METLCTGAQCINKRDSPRHDAIAPVSGYYSIFPIQRLLRCIRVVIFDKDRADIRVTIISMICIMTVSHNITTTYQR